ncbi:MAG TPA: cytochrome c peroxidase [Polyangiaceae bacterium]
MNRDRRTRAPRAKATALVLALLAALFAACTRGASEEPAAEIDPFETAGDQPLDPLPLEVDFDPARVALGEKLFRERLLSGDGKIACSDCHKQEHGLADYGAQSSVEGRPATAVNTPGMYNARYLFRFNWGGRFETLEEHNDALMKNPNVMASSWERAAQNLAGRPDYQTAFREVFGDGITPGNVRTALLEYERSLITPNAPFDRYLRGDKDAISPEARRGFALFKDYGCASCHQGAAVGGNMLQRFGVMRDYFADRGDVKPPDFGRFNVTAREEDRFVFRVPSLRNVALTAPYFHDGSAPTLERAVAVMARYQLGRELEPDEVSRIVAFLGTLSGEYRGQEP